VTETSYTSPQTRPEVIGDYFLEHRAKLIDLAAWLDRIDRARPESGEADYRYVAFMMGLDILTDGEPHRAKRILHLLSDHTTDLPQSADGIKAADGAPKLAAGGNAI
jgi:hypothetical protein